MLRVSQAKDRGGKRLFVEPETLLWTRELKQTPFHSMHAEAGAKFGEFAGHDMPLFYPLGVMKEHQHTRDQAGLFDISHMVHIEVAGAEAAQAIERACPYMAREQDVGSSKYTFFLTEDAGIIDDLIVTRLGEERYLIVANAGCAEKDIAHITQVASAFDCAVHVIPRAFLALQGPKAESVLKAEDFDVADMDFMTGTEPREGWFLSRTGYTGEDGFEIGMPIEQGPAFAEKLLNHAAVEWIGLGARDSLRLEAGLSLYGQDLDETITPHEAGLIWAIPKELREGGPFIGADALAGKIADGRKRKRVGLVPAERKPVRAGAGLFNGDTEIGTVTSGGFGPTYGGPVALGLIAIDADETTIEADVRGKRVPMQIAKLPFAPHNYKR